MAKTKTVTGKCDIMSHTDKDLTCAKKDCEILKKLISNGMYVVEADDKYFHANCARQLGIDFKVPLPKKRKKESSNS